MCVSVVPLLYQWCIFIPCYNASLNTFTPRKYPVYVRGTGTCTQARVISLYDSHFQDIAQIKAQYLHVCCVPHRPSLSCCQWWSLLAIKDIRVNIKSIDTMIELQLEETKRKLTTSVLGLQEPRNA